MLDKSPEQQIQAPDKAKIRDSAFRLLSRREHSQCELLRKLVEKGFPRELCDTVINQLASDGYQSQRRFTEMWINSRAARYYGENKIRSELSHHQISTSLVNELIIEAEVDWFELCLQSLRKKFGQQKKNSDHSASDWTVKQKQKRYLWQRGFTDEQIGYALGSDADESGF